MKARLKSVVLSAIGVLAVFTAVTYTSCNTDKCKAIVCAYGGTCNEGDCICPSGYEGTHCEIITRDKYKGVWTVFEDGTATNPEQYELTFEYGLGNTEMTIRHFYNRFNGNVNVRVKGDSLFIPQQKIEGYSIEGWGTLDWEEFYPDHGELTVYYKVTDATGKTNDFGINNGEPSIWTR